MLLGSIANISTGLVVSRKKAQGEHEIKAKYKLISLKNVDEDGVFNEEPLEQFYSHEKLEGHYFTKEGDILVRLSHPHTSVYIDEEHSGLLVPSYFAIIKVHREQAVPKFIAWYLNTIEVKKELERSQSGSRIPSTNQNVLKTIPIILPLLHKQQALIKLWHLHQHERDLINRLLEQKELYFQAISKQLIHGNERGGN